MLVELNLSKYIEGSGVGCRMSTSRDPSLNHITKGIANKPLLIDYETINYETNSLTFAGFILMWKTFGTDVNNE
jgi:hypothetical protein